jgi:hypothetical protein
MIQYTNGAYPKLNGLQVNSPVMVITTFNSLNNLDINYKSSHHVNVGLVLTLSLLSPATEPPVRNTKAAW